MVDPPVRREPLEGALRPDEVADDLVFLLRGGVHKEGIERLRAQAGELNLRFSLNGGDCYGVSVFAATPESEAWVLARNMGVRRRYYRIQYGLLAGFRLVPTFRSPHWTVFFAGPDGPDYQRFLDALGVLRDNPYWKQRPGRRPR